MGLSFTFGEEEENFFDIGASETAQQLVDRYIAALVEKKRTKKHTDEARRKLLFVFNHSTSTPQKWGRRAMKAFLAERRDQGMSDWTLKGETVVCKAFFKWLYNEKLFLKDLLDGLELPEIKEEVTDKTAASKADIDGWLRANNEYYGDP